MRSAPIAARRLREHAPERKRGRWLAASGPERPCFHCSVFKRIAGYLSKRRADDSEHGVGQASQRADALRDIDCELQLSDGAGEGGKLRVSS